MNLLQEDINDVTADGLVLSIDDQICAIGGTIAAKALKSSFANEAEDTGEQIELYKYAEEWGSSLPSDLSNSKEVRNGDLINTT